MNTKNITTVWFIDDHAHLRQEIKQCFDIKQESAIYTNDKSQEFKISVINPGIDGREAIDLVHKTGHDNGYLVPDLILLDLRYPIDKQNNELNILELHGIKVMEEILKNEYMKNSCVVIFSEYFIDAPTKTIIIQKSKLKERETRFIEKQKIQYDSKSLSDVNIKKNCQSIKHFINQFVAVE